MLQDAGQVSYIREHLDMETILVPEMRNVMQAIFRCADSGQPINLTALQQYLNDNELQEVGKAQAFNHATRLQRQDIDMYLERLQTAKPLDEKVKSMDDTQFTDFFADLGKKKGAHQPEADE